MRLFASMLATTVLAVGPLMAAGPPVSAMAVAVEPPRMPTSPCLGAGYVPYAYPGIDTCPCASDGCYPPARYYCGGDPYRRHWLRKWLNAHFRGGSMLDHYPCQCIYPTDCRTWLPAIEQPESPARRAPGAEEFVR